MNNNSVVTPFSADLPEYSARNAALGAQGGKIRDIAFVVTTHRHEKPASCLPRTAARDGAAGCFLPHGTPRRLPGPTPHIARRCEAVVPARRRN